MKRHQILFNLIFLIAGYCAFAQDSENQQLWLITAKITHSSTYQRDTTSSFMAGTKKWEKEFHQSSKETASGTISTVVENQAENPGKDFLYHSDSGDPVRITVTGNGSHSESSNGRETIDGTLISADIRTDNVSGSAHPGATVYFEYSDDNKYFSVSMGIKAVGSYSGRMYSGGIGYGEWKDYGGDYDDYGLSLGGGGDAQADTNCKITKTGKGFQGSWKESESKKHQTASGPEYRTNETTIEITVMPFKESDKPTVTLLGCSELGAGEQSMVVATGKPVGGTFRFWAEPSSMITVETDGSSANLTGATPEKGTLFVEYTTVDGKTNTASQPASCVKIDDYNGGQEIPQIPLFDVDGKKTTGVLKIPVSAQPSNIEELVDFVVADNSVLSAVGLSGAVEFTGSREGKTVVQAKTNCGNPTGPAVNVEVVNCDDETIATLERMMEVAKVGQKQAYQAIERIVGTKEFEELDSKIAESTGNLAVKTAGLIIGTLAGGKTAGAGVETAAGIYGKASNVMDIMKGGDVMSQVSNLSQLIVELGGSAIQQTIAGGIETFQAANEFGQDLGKMIGANRELQSAIKEAEHWNNIIIDIVGRQKLCRRSSQKPQENQQPVKDPVTKPDEPTPTTEEPKAQTTTPPVQDPVAAEETPATEPATTEQPAEDGTEISPPSPTSEPRQIGLPYSPADCGCNDSKKLGVTEAGFSTLQSGMENLGKCVDNFSKGPLTSYIQTLQDWQTVLNSLLEATKVKPEEFQQVSEKSIPKMEALLVQTKSFDTEGKTFISEFEKCPESVSSGMDVLRSAETITVDSIKTKY